MAIGSPVELPSSTSSGSHGVKVGCLPRLWRNSPCEGRSGSWYRFGRAFRAFGNRTSRTKAPRYDIAEHTGVSSALPCHGSQMDSSLRLSADNGRSHCTDSPQCLPDETSQCQFQPRRRRWGRRSSQQAYIVHDGDAHDPQIPTTVHVAALFGSAYVSDDVVFEQTMAYCLQAHPPSLASASETIDRFQQSDDFKTHVSCATRLDLANAGPSGLELKAAADSFDIVDAATHCDATVQGGDAAVLTRLSPGSCDRSFCDYDRESTCSFESSLVSDTTCQALEEAAFDPMGTAEHELAVLGEALGVQTPATARRAVELATLQAAAAADTAALGLSENQQWLDDTSRQIQEEQVHAADAFFSMYACMTSSSFAKSIGPPESADVREELCPSIFSHPASSPGFVASGEVFEVPRLSLASPAMIAAHAARRDGARPCAVPGLARSCSAPFAPRGEHVNQIGY